MAAERHSAADRNAERIPPTSSAIDARQRVTARSSSQRRERQQRYYAGALYCDRELALMPRTVARGTAWHDFAPLGYEVLQGAHVLIIHFERLIGAEPADLAPSSAGAPACTASLAPAAVGGAIAFGALSAAARPAAVLMAALAGILLGCFFFGHFRPVSFYLEPRDRARKPPV
jgi:hypothetical protein